MSLTALHLAGFADRACAGEQLAQALAALTPPPPRIVLALPRGGVPVAFEIARELRAPLDVLSVRKIGLPGQQEFAIGAIASGGIIVRDPASLRFGPDARAFTELVRLEQLELARRERAYRAGRAPLDLKGKTVILVDDGLATGSTMIAAIRAARQVGAAAVIAAAPVASAEAAALIASEADATAILTIPPALHSVGEWYEDFTQTQDREVRELLERSRSGWGKLA